MRPVNEIAARLGIPEDKLELYGRYKAKIDYQALLSEKRGKLIMVTAMTPTPAGRAKPPRPSVWPTPLVGWARRSA